MRDVLTFFSNFRNGMEVLKKVLTQLLLYYTRLQVSVCDMCDMCDVCAVCAVVLLYASLVGTAQQLALTRLSLHTPLSFFQHRS